MSLMLHILNKNPRNILAKLFQTEMFAFRVLILYKYA